MATVNLNQNEKEQWTVGAPDLLSSMLLKTILFLRSNATDKKKEKEVDKYITESGDVTIAYQKIITNINDFFDPRSNKKLQSPTLKHMNRPLDYSALLGAYFRQAVKGADGKPVVELSADELDAVYNFVKPLAGNFTPEKYLALFKKSPRENHIAVLNEFIFHGVTANERKAMFKNKYTNLAHELIQNILVAIEFIRTPFSVLNAEERTAEELAKAGKTNSKTSGIDLQWQTMFKAIERGMDNLIVAKKDRLHVSSELGAELDAAKQQLRESIQKCQGSYAATNARYQAKLEAEKFLEVLGGAGETAENFAKYLAWFREETIKAEGVGITKNEKEKINKMSLRELFAKFAEQQEKRQTEFFGESSSSFANYVSFYRNEVIKAEGEGISAAVKTKIEQMSLRELLDKNIEQQAVYLQNALDNASGLKKDNVALKEQLAAAKEEVRGLNFQLHAQKAEFDAQLANKDAAMTKQRLYLEKRNKIATEKLPALIKEKDGLTQQLSASKERIKQLEQQLAAASAKDKPEKPALAALGEQEHQLTDEEMQLIAKLGALQKQAGEESDTLLFDKKLFIFCSEKIQELCKKTIKDPKDLLSEVEILTKIMKTTKTIEDTLNTRGDSTSKAKALTIHQAMNEIDVVKRKDLLKIKDLKPGQEFAAAQKFVDGLLIQRAILFKTTEAASFTLFKKEMEAIQPLVEAKKPSKPR